MLTGMPFNQLGTLASTSCYGLNAAYYYIRWLVALCTARFSDWSYYMCLSVLARLAKLPIGLYILPSVIFFYFLNGDKLSQDQLDRFSRCLHQNDRY